MPDPTEPNFNQLGASENTEETLGATTAGQDVPTPIESIELPPPQDAVEEGQWLKSTLHKWLDEEFLPEVVNEHIAARASQVFVRQRMEGENNLNALVLAVLTEMQGYDFSKSFYSEFAIANAVGDLLLESLGIERCCGNE